MRSARIDLHAHSHRSDGTDSPAELVAAARAAGLDLVALTDHDTAAGWSEAQAAAEQHGVQLLLGMEISCRHGFAGVHLLGYGMDPAHPGLVAELDLVLAGRQQRLPLTIARLQAIGIEVTEQDVHDVAGDAAAAGRPHVADALVRAGVVTDRDEAFERFLMPGRPAYVDRYAADLATTVGLVRAAGGVAVLAHPLARGSRRVMDADTISALAAAGLAGLEADHQDHTAEDRAWLHRTAAGLGLVATGSSDYHGTGKVGHPLGVHTTRPDRAEHLLALLADSQQSARSRGLRPPPLPSL